MPVGTTFDSGNHINWSPVDIAREVLRFREANLVLSSRGILKKEKELAMKQGVDIPEVAEVKTQNVGPTRDYTPQAISGTVKQVRITHFKTAPFSIGKDMAIQSQVDGKAAYGPAAGYAISKDIEDAVWTALDTSEVTQVITPNAFMIDDNLRQLAQFLEDADAMQHGDCYIAMSPQDKGNVIGKIDKYGNMQFIGTGKTPFTTGKLPDIHGMVPLVTTRAGVDASSRRRVLAFQKEGFAVATQKVVPMEVMAFPLRVDYVPWALWGEKITRANHLAWAKITP